MLRPSNPLDSWPILSHALAWLRERNVLTDNQAADLVQASHKDADGFVDQLVEAIQQQFANALQESISFGEGPAAWRQRVAEIADVSSHWADTTLQTATHQSQLAGLQTVLDESPVVGEIFPLWRYYATRDTRVRPTHWMLDGLIAYRDSPLGRLMVARHNEHRCRCVVSPYTLEDAERHGGIAAGGNPGDPLSMLERYMAAKPARRRRRRAA
jgi:hypothetical protein